jgi:hypothetical protein
MTMQVDEADRTAGFLDAIDHSHAAADSVVLRYRDAVRLESADDADLRLKELFATTSIREGLRIVSLGTLRGVEIDLLDETTLTRTRTLKSIDGCVTIAHCLRDGTDRIVFESGANTGTALTVYGNAVGLETFLFVPAENLDLLDAGCFADPRAHVFSLPRPADVKPAAAAFAKEHGVRRVPETAWRVRASTFTGCFLLEALLAGRRVDVLAQSISAAFGPIGIYGVLTDHLAAVGTLPAFLGVQQASNPAMVRAWEAGVPEGAGAPLATTSNLLARVMYDGVPTTYGTFEPLRHLLDASGGWLRTVDGDEFVGAMATEIDGEPVLGRLAAQGIDITLAPDGAVLEKAGLLGLAGTVQEILAGRIAPGSRVLVCITGGTARPQPGVVAVALAPGSAP